MSAQHSTAAQASMHISTTLRLLESTGVTEASGFTLSSSHISKLPALRRRFACKGPSQPLAANWSPFGTIALFSQPKCSHAPLLTPLRATSLLSSRSRVPSTGSFSAKRCTEANPALWPSPFSPFFALREERRCSFISFSSQSQSQIRSKK
jgi:hypothetical protein